MKIFLHVLCARYLDTTEALRKTFWLRHCNVHVCVCGCYNTGKLPLSIAVSNLSTGVNTLEINLSDAAGETVTYATNITIAAGTFISV